MVIKLFYAEPEWCYRDHIKSFHPWPIVGSLCFKVLRQNLEIRFRKGCWECPLSFQKQSWHYTNLVFCQPIVLILKSNWTKPCRKQLPRTDELKHIYWFQRSWVRKFWELVMTEEHHYLCASSSCFCWGCDQAVLLHLWCDLVNHSLGLGE